METISIGGRADRSTTEFPIICAGPTCGKDVFRAAASMHHVTFFTDDMFKHDEAYREWITRGYYRKPYESRDERDHFLSKTINVGLGLATTAWFQTVLHDTKSRTPLIITNHWEKDYVKWLPSGLLSEGRLPVGVFRDSIDEMISLASAGGWRLEKATAQSWRDNFMENSQKHFKEIILLREGEFLSDVINPGPIGGVSLSMLEVADLNRDEALIAMNRLLTYGYGYVKGGMHV